MFDANNTAARERIVAAIGKLGIKLGDCPSWEAVADKLEAIAANAPAIFRQGDDSDAYDLPTGRASDTTAAGAGGPVMMSNGPDPARRPARGEDAVVKRQVELARFHSTPRRG